MRKNSKSKRVKVVEDKYRAGLIYRCVARTYVEGWHPEMDKHAFDEILLKGSIDEIETYAKVKEIMRVTVTLLRSILEKSNIHLVKDAFEVLLYSETPEYDLEEAIIEIRLRNYSLEDKVSICHTLIAAAHDVWVSANSDWFFDEKKAGQRYLFMPYELIGAEQAFKYYHFVKELMTLMEMNASDEALVGGFYEIRAAFFEKNDILTREELIDYIMKADYNPLERDIVEKLRTDRKIATEIADQIIDQI